MDLRELVAYRWHFGAVVALTVLVLWYGSSYRPRADEDAALDDRIDTLRREQDQIAAQIEIAEREIAEARIAPARVVPALAADLSPIERLNYFLDNITRPANDLDLSYFTVTPQAPVTGPSHEEIPFTIAVRGSYAALADYLYQLEYGRDFVVRNLSLAVGAEGAVQADFQLSALLLTDPSRSAAAPVHADPGRPTGLELARNPFTRPPARLAVGPDGKSYFLNVPPGLHLSGVMQTGGRKVAIINHEPYAVGATIDNKTITKIDPRGVEMTDDVRTYFLEMEQPAPSLSGRAQETRRR